MRYWILPLALAMVYAGVSEADVERQGNDAGVCSVEADLVDLDQGWVELLTSDGKRIDLPAAELSRADQRWIRDHDPSRKQLLLRRPATRRNPARA